MGSIRTRKITKIETILLRSRATLIWVRIHTDEGIIGLGESWFGCAAIETDIHGDPAHDAEA